jgi:hypothetical protein
LLPHLLLMQLPLLIRPHWKPMRRLNVCDRGNVNANICAHCSM